MSNDANGLMQIAQNIDDIKDISGVEGFENSEDFERKKYFCSYQSDGNQCLNIHEKNGKSVFSLNGPFVYTTGNENNSLIILTAHVVKRIGVGDDVDGEQDILVHYLLDCDQKKKMKICEEERDESKYSFEFGKRIVSQYDKETSEKKFYTFSHLLKEAEDV